MPKLLILLSLLTAACAVEAPKNETPASTTDSSSAAIQMPVENTTPEADTFPKKESDLAYLMGQFDPATHPDFMLIPEAYADRADRYLRKDAFADYQRMYEAARADGIALKIISATRNFANQKSIWEAKWTGQRILSDGVNAATDIKDPAQRARKILEYSSMPGSSRHHWGTDIDLNALNNEHFEEGEGRKVYEWLQAHASEYGFCQPYTAGRPYGYFEEKWHWSYLPVARPLTDLAKKSLRNEMISGFEGAETAGQIDILQHYVLGINEDCL